MGKSNLQALNAALFRELERVEACETPEQLERECERAKAVSSLAGNITANANTALKAVALGTGVAEQVQVRNMLLEAPDAQDAGE